MRSHTDISSRRSDDTISSAYDPYAFVRDAYLQRRAYLVSDGKDTGDALVDPDADLPPDTSTKRDPNVPAPPASAVPQ